jgi:DNA-binding transcriptional ArsR family regulator
MNMMKIFKALSNEARLRILQCLKNPADYFTPEECEGKNIDMKKIGVCVGLLQQKLGLSQSTTSEYLAILLEAGLVQVSRIGQWTYYRRNEPLITEFAKQLKITL